MYVLCILLYIAYISVKRKRKVRYKNIKFWVDMGNRDSSVKGEDDVPFQNNLLIFSAVNSAN